MPRKIIIPTVFMSIFLSYLPIAVFGSESDVLINEIMYNPADSSTGGEFVEIYNRGSTAVDVGGWRLEDSAQVMFTLPEGTIIPAGGYLVFYDDITAPDYYGLDMNISYGPYTGGLDGSGERIALKNAGGTIVNELTYDDRSPWPIEADGFGPSLELINPALDNSLGSSWGIGQPYTPGAPNNPATASGGDIVITEIQYNPIKGGYIQSLDPFWSSQPAYWNEGDDETGEFIEIYNKSDQAIHLADWKLLDEMGILFQFPAGTSLAPKAYLAICSDSAAIASRFGIANVVGNFTNPGNQLSNGGERIMLLNAAGAIIDAVHYRDTPPWPIAPDQNGVSLECLDPAADNSIPANWRSFRGTYTQTVVGAYTYLNRGTPGMANSVSSSGLPPFVDVSEFKHSPKRPTSANSITITTEVSSGETIASVTLYYEVFVAPYQTAVMTGSIPMADDGLHGDGLAGDGKYGAILAPLASQSLLRYKVTVADGSGRSWTYPDVKEPNPNRAAFVYDGEEDTNLPAYFLILPQSTLDALKANIWTHTYYDATLVVEGKVYDHVGVHYRGRGWRVHPKKSFRIAFNKGEYLRDMSRLDLAMHFPVLQKIVHDLFWTMGHGCLASEPVRLYTLKDGVFGLYGLMLAQEAPTTSWLERHGYDDDGEVFKASCAPSFGSCPTWGGTYIADLDHYSDATLYPKMYEKKGDPLGSFDTLIDLCDQVANTSEPNMYATLAENVELDDWLYKWTVHVAGNYGDFIGTNYYVVNPAEEDLKWQLRYFDFDMFFGCMGLNFQDVICCPYDLSPYNYYAKWQERVFSNSALEQRFLTILADTLQNYMSIDKVYAMFDYWFDRTYVDRMEEIALGWVGPGGPYVMAEANITKGKEYFADRYGWLVNTWLPSRGYTPPANAHPTVTVADPVWTAGGIQITWQYNDPENDICTVDLYWMDLRWSHLEPVPLAKNLPADQGSFLWADSFPANEYLNRGIYIHAVIRDNVSDLEGRATSHGPLTVPPQDCGEVWERGYGLPEDLNTDCHVDLKDLALVAAGWLEDNLEYIPTGWNFYNDYSILNGNPNGVWSYGILDRYYSNFQLYTYRIGPGGDILMWGGEPNLRDWCMPSDPDSFGNFSQNVAAGYLYYPGWPHQMYWGVGMVNFMTPNSSNWRYKPCARFTAPASATYQVGAIFRNSVTDESECRVLVMVNGQTMDSMVLSGFGYASNPADPTQTEPDPNSVFTYNASISLAAGDTVDFVNSNYGNGLYYHHVGLEINITNTTSEYIEVCGGNNFQYMRADINQDCYVDFDDLLSIVNQWLAINDPENPDFQPNW